MTILHLFGMFCDLWLNFETLHIICHQFLTQPTESFSASPNIFACYAWWHILILDEKKQLEWASGISSNQREAHGPVVFFEGPALSAPLKAVQLGYHKSQHLQRAGRMQRAINVASSLVIRFRERKKASGSFELDSRLLFLFLHCHLFPTIPFYLSFFRSFFLSFVGSLFFSQSPSSLSSSFSSLWSLSFFSPLFPLSPLLSSVSQMSHVLPLPSFSLHFLYSLWSTWLPGETRSTKKHVTSHNSLHWFIQILKWPNNQW